MFEIENPQPDRITFDRNGLPHLPEGGMEAHIRSIVAFCENMMPFTPLRLKTAGLRLWSHYDNVQNGGIL